MCSKGAFVDCWVGVAGASAFCREAGVVAKVRCVRSEVTAVLLAKVRANEQLGQAIVMFAGDIECEPWIAPCCSPSLEALKSRRW